MDMLVRGRSFFVSSSDNASHLGGALLAPVGVLLLQPSAVGDLLAQPVELVLVIVAYAYLCLRVAYDF